MSNVTTRPYPASTAHPYTDPITPNPALYLGPRLLRMFYEIEALCNNPDGYCYAKLEYLANERGRESSTVRRQIADLIRLGMVRKVRTAGGRQLLFICHHSAWNPLPDCTQNAHSHSIEENPLKASPKKTTKPAREQASTPTPIIPDPAPVVVISAKASGEEESPSVQATYMSPECVQSPEDREHIADLLASSISAAEEEVQALGEGEGGADAVISGPNAPMLASTFSAPPEPDLISKPAPEALQTPEIGQSRRAPSEGDSTRLTTEQQAILTQLLHAGVAERQGQQMVRGDAEKAEGCLRVLAGYRRRGKVVEEPGGLLWSLWCKADFVAPPERGRVAQPTGMARDEGLRIAAGPPKPLRPTTAPPLQTSAQEALRSARRRVNPAFRD